MTQGLSSPDLIGDLITNNLEFHIEIPQGGWEMTWINLEFLYKERSSGQVRNSRISRLNLEFLLRL